MLSTFKTHLFSVVYPALPDEAITGSVHGEEVLRLFGVRFKFLAQTDQVRIHGPSGWVILISPNIFQKAIAGQRFAGVADEVLQQLELRRRDIEGLARPQHAMPAQV